ncbi:hypothetical protein FGB62_73g113 [Gracilaria domingensis]|nr:hypothetical protein FGB62_73g113 [Gracilaria domingensis]
MTHSKPVTELKRVQFAVQAVHKSKSAKRDARERKACCLRKLRETIGTDTSVRVDILEQLALVAAKPGRTTSESIETIFTNIKAIEESAEKENGWQIISREMVHNEAVQQNVKENEIFCRYMKKKQEFEKVTQNIEQDSTWEVDSVVSVYYYWIQWEAHQIIKNSEPFTTFGQPHWITDQASVPFKCTFSSLTSLKALPAEHPGSAITISKPAAQSFEARLVKYACLDTGRLFKRGKGGNCMEVALLNSVASFCGRSVAVECEVALEKELRVVRSFMSYNFILQSLQFHVELKSVCKNLKRFAELWKLRDRCFLVQLGIEESKDTVPFCHAVAIDG